VLDEISFEARLGAHLAIVGPSGSGKSTLVNLLLRFWDYEEGEIQLAGEDLRRIDPHTARRQVAVVPQNPYLFSATIRDNLLLARPDVTQAELDHVVGLVQLHDFVGSLPQGYNTWAGEYGLRLSGGERQRLAIARALLKDAPILLLDEATANLDSMTARAVLEAVQKRMAGRTLLMITHNLAGLESADEILVIRQGSITQRGRHAELLKRDGLYLRMWQSQRQALRE
jgi:ATP-binding cassette subfamily C protein CydC